MRNSQTMRTRTHYIPLEAARAGMELAVAVRDSYQRSMLPAGAKLSDENIHQLQVHQVEYICVTVEDSRAASQVAQDTALAAKNILEIFEKADLSEPVMAALFNQVFTYRSA